jgi:hypothetical protein
MAAAEPGFRTSAPGTAVLLLWELAFSLAPPDDMVTVYSVSNIGVDAAHGAEGIRASTDPGG